jgi:hypothetical protein
VAAGLFAVLVGAVASLTVPGLWFLLVWAAVATAVALAAGYFADEINAFLLVVLALLTGLGRGTTR